MAQLLNKKAAVFLFTSLMVMATVIFTSCHTTQVGYGEMDSCMVQVNCDMNKCMSDCQIKGFNGGLCDGESNDHCCCTDEARTNNRFLLSKSTKMVV
uniref:Knottin scorpion toxin-like domain-containing protein n=1 Tax=Oryza glaberrima TaxID=4538 RepID=I1R275_ORYGL